MLPGMVEVGKGGCDAWWWHTAREKERPEGWCCLATNREGGEAASSIRSCWAEETIYGNGGGDSREERG